MIHFMANIQMYIVLNMTIHTITANGNTIDAEELHLINTTTSNYMYRKLL